MAQEMKPLPPKTAEKVGTGLPKQPDGPPEGPGTSQTSTGTGSAKYDDGYEMSKTPDGKFWLKDSAGTQAAWDFVNQQWADFETGNPMPDGWSKGHYPAAEAADTGQGTAQAHPLNK